MVRKNLSLWLISLLLLVAGGAALPVIGQGDAPLPEVTEQVRPAFDAELFAPLIFPVVIASDVYNNPFDTADIELIGIFRAPSGREQVIPGFWMQPYENRCQQPCEAEDLQPVGDPTWQVRFTPQETGEWTYVLQVRDNGSLVTSDSGQFTVQPSNKPGFIQVGPNRRYFQYQDGRPYFPIGHNLNWSWEGEGGLAAYEVWFQELSRAGGNYARVIIDMPWFISLEWQRPVGDYRGSQLEATRLDALIDMAAENGIALQLVLLWHQALRYYMEPPVVIPTTPARPDVSADWDNNPYNVLNGGPLSGPGVFFYDEQARELFRQRLLYIVARWGYSPQVFAWELVDQIDRTTNDDPTVADAWLQDTASYLRQIDQQGHLITVGSRNNQFTPAANPVLDFFASQFYQRRPLETASDQVAGVLGVIRYDLHLRQSPVLLTGYSLNPWFEPVAEDPTGVHVQNTLWASALSGAAGGAAADWWDTYIIPQGLTRYYAPLAAFVAGIDWPNLNLQPAEAGVFASNHNQDIYTPVLLQGFSRQFRVLPAGDIIVTVTPEGADPQIENVPVFLYGTVYNTQFRQPQTYIVAPAIDTFFNVSVKAVSGDADALLEVTVDGAIAAQLDLPVGSKNVAVRVPITAGEHAIVLNNVGADWLELDHIEIGGIYAPVRVLTLRDSQNGVALAWLQNRDYTWDKVAAGEERPIWESLHYRLSGLPPGRYGVEQSDPLTGAVLGQENLNVYADGVLVVDLLPVDTQLALRIFRQSGLPEQTTPASLPTRTLTPTPFPTESPTLTATEPSPTNTSAPLLINTNTPRPAETASSGG